MPSVLVLGSVHMDLIATAERLPDPGESVTGGVFSMSPGGKAGNQACQFALAGAEAAILTRLGDDAFGRELLAGLAARGVDVGFVAIDREAATGASTVLAAGGDYASIIAPGAANRLSLADLDRAGPALQRADALVLQLELPIAVSAAAAARAAAMGRKVVLNASPSLAWPNEIPAALRDATSILVVNRVEADRLLGRRFRPEALESDLAALGAEFANAVIIVTLGAAGAFGVGPGGFARQPAFPAEMVDAVGAGDGFLGTAVTALLEGQPLPVALRRGAAAGALAVSRRGVYEALPSRAEVDAFLDRAASASG